MWLFDDTDMTHDDVVRFAIEGDADAVRQFPERVLNNPGHMLALVQAGHGDLALSYCSDALKKDVVFLRQVADLSHYTTQAMFFERIDPGLKNDRSLLAVFAAKRDDPHVQQAQDVKDRLHQVMRACPDRTRVHHRV